MFALLAVAAGVFLILLRLTCFWCRQMTSQYDDDETVKLIAPTTAAAAVPDAAGIVIDTGTVQS